MKLIFDRVVFNKFFDEDPKNISESGGKFENFKFQKHGLLITLKIYE